MLKVRSVPGALRWTRSALLHAAFQRHHRAGHLRVIHRADVEIQILKRLGAHARRLRHARRRPAQHAPARFVDAIILHRPDDAGIKLHAVAGTSEFSFMLSAAADGDVGLHLFHAEHLDVADVGGLLFRSCPATARARRACGASRRTACAPAARTARMSSMVNSSGTSIMSSRTRSPFLSCGGIIHEQFGQFGVTRIGHKASRLTGRTILSSGVIVTCSPV